MKLGMWIKFKVGNSNMRLFFDKNLVKTLKTHLKPLKPKLFKIGEIGMWVKFKVGNSIMKLIFYEKLVETFKTHLKPLKLKLFKMSETWWVD